MENNNIENFTFKCKISDNCIEYKCYKNEGEANIEYNYIDTNIPKSYFVLLRVSIDSLKKKNYKKILQKVYVDDWNKYLKDDNWKIRSSVQDNDINCHIIECDIDDALGCIARGLGFSAKQAKSY